MIVFCENCGKELKRKPSRVKKHPLQFCNMKCMGEYQSNNPDSWCNRSGVLGNPEKVQFIKDHYLEMTDKELGPHIGLGEVRTQQVRLHLGLKKNVGVQVICDYCGNEFKRQPAIAKANERDFCNRECFLAWQKVAWPFVGPNHPHWKGGYWPYYGKNWTRQRRKARKRDNHTCRHCSLTETELGQQLDVHHLIAFRQFLEEANNDVEVAAKNANRLGNLLCLCRSCHMALEGNLRTC